MRAFLDTACGGAKISARIAVVTTHVAIAPDLSHACTLHRRACRPLLLASKRSEGGLSTARLKSGAAKSWGKTDPGRAEIFAPPHARSHLTIFPRLCLTLTS